ncbi:DeoR/GlpR family DNA-binding transcription regulator [Rossellomorea aquimaris]|jgi:DeoR family transcriptional regulator, fructose operon transcriptional repressor|uniref:DeoR family transcriptional regulator n=1 Tax=Rossellomorea aquimaris TaxID=189382 RepID=A0A1J6WLV6_9BACI|nr:DeoR/GlpR family DNA-binding transcription regulator [Rossellomorea aquimaris]OIU72792.1 DeoR family transcriptional regulator [Rossellomorea aquimaris]
MLTEERHRIILDLLKDKETIKIQDIAELTEASESTIRRDLTQLEQGKYLKRVHGGAARLQGKLKELTVSEKTSKSFHEKSMIGRFAAGLVEEGDCIFLDAGTTTLGIIEFLPEIDIVIVTNGLTHVDALLQKGFKTYLIGGSVKPTTKAVIGSGAIESLQKYRFDKAFLGTNGVHPQYGFTTPDPEEAQVKKTSIELSREAFILADDSKFGEIAFSKIADLNEAVVITNGSGEEPDTAYMEKTTVKVVTA